MFYDGGQRGRVVSRAMSLAFEPDAISPNARKGRSQRRGSPTADEPLAAPEEAAFQAHPGDDDMVLEDDIFYAAGTQQGSSSQQDAGRAHDDLITSSAAPATSGAAGSATADGISVQPEPQPAAVEPAAPVPIDELHERVALMFKTDAEGAVASGRGALVSKADKELVQFAWLAAGDLCDEHGAELSRVYGNFDRVVALGWVLGDVALGCLIDKADAFKVGRKAGKLAPGLKAEFEAPGRSVRKKKYTSDEALAQALDAAAQKEEKIRREVVTLPFPAAPAPTPPAVPQQEHHTEEASMPPPPPPAPPAPPAPVLKPTDERLTLLKTMRTADAKVIAADGELVRAKRERERTQQQWDTLLEYMRNPRRTAQISDARWEELRLEQSEVREKLVAATRAVGDAEQACHMAKFDAREAAIGMKEYEAARSRRERFELEEAEIKRVDEEKDDQIFLGLEAMNEGLDPGDPEYWQPTLEQLRHIHASWKLYE